MTARVGDDVSVRRGESQRTIAKKPPKRPRAKDLRGTMQFKTSPCQIKYERRTAKYRAWLERRLNVAVRHLVPVDPTVERVVLDVAISIRASAKSFRRVLR